MTDLNINVKVVDQASRSIKRIEQSVSRMGQRVSSGSTDAARGMDRVNASAERMGRSVSRSTGRVGGLFQRLSGIMGGVMSEGASMLVDRFNGLGGVLGVVGNIAGRVMRTLRNVAVIGFGAAVTAIGLAVNKANEFSSAFARLQAASGRSREELRRVAEQAMRLGATTSFTAVQVLQLDETLARAGFNPDEIMNLTGSVLNFARGSDLETDQAADIIGTNLRVFGEGADQATRFADAMFKATTLVNTDAEQLGEALRDAAPVFAALGGTVEDATAGVAALADAGFRGGRGGTAIRAIIARLSGAGANRAQAARLRNVGIADANTAFFRGEGADRRFDLGKAIDSFREATVNMTDDQRLSLAKELVGEEAAAPFLALLGQAPGRIRELTQALEEANGAAEEAARVMEDNLGGDVNKLTSALEGLALKLGSGLEPVFRILVQQVTAIVGALDSWIQRNPQAVAELGMFILTLFEFGKQIGLFTAQVVSAIASVFSFISRSISTIASALPGGTTISAALSAGGAALEAMGQRSVNRQRSQQESAALAGGNVGEVLAANVTTALGAPAVANTNSADPENTRATSENTSGVRELNRTIQENTRAVNRAAASAASNADTGGAPPAGVE